MFDWMRRRTLIERLQSMKDQAELDMELSEQRRDDADLHAGMYAARVERLSEKISYLEEQTHLPLEAVWGIGLAPSDEHAASVQAGSFGLREGLARQAFQG